MSWTIGCVGEEPNKLVLLLLSQNLDLSEYRDTKICEELNNFKIQEYHMYGNNKLYLFKFLNYKLFLKKTLKSCF